jgi:hypothetical protein
MRRPAIFTAAVLLICGTFLAGEETAVKPAPKAGMEKKPQIDSEAVEKASDAALAYLAKQQAAEGDARGSFSLPNGTDTGLVACGLLAFLSSGSTPGRGPYGREAALCVDYLCANAQPWGEDSAGRKRSLLWRDGGRGGIMYHHGLATLALAEAWGESRDPRVGEILQQAVRLILDSQTVGMDALGRRRYGVHHGGWRYQPRPGEADLSVTVMQVVALRASQNAGVDVPRAAIDHAVEYLKRCYDPAEGNFRYQPEGNVHKGPALNAGAALALELAGAYDAPETIAAVKAASGADEKDFQHWRYYLAYYAAQAMYQHGQGWEAFHARMAAMALADQQSAGGPAGPIAADQDSGTLYSTAAAVQILNIPRGFLPIYQR